MTHSSTLSRILGLYDEERKLLDRCSCGEWIARDDLARFAEIRTALEALWPKRRAEIVFSLSGPPRLVSAPDEHARRRLIAHGIAPLPAMVERRET